MFLLIYFFTDQLSNEGKDNRYVETQPELEVRFIARSSLKNRFRKSQFSIQPEKQYSHVSMLP